MDFLLRRLSPTLSIARDDNFVLIVNGKTRKLEKPKLKKIKHLSKMNKKSDVIDSLDKNDLQSQNKKIRNVIFELLEVK